MEFLTGFGCVFRGLGRLATTPTLWVYAAAPLIAAGGLSIVLARVLKRYADETAAWAHEWAHDVTGAGAWAEWVVKLLMYAFAIVLAFYLFTTLVRLVAAPVLALLADRTVAGLSGRPSPSAPGGPLVRWVVRPFAEALLVFAIRIAITLAALPLLFIPVAGGLAFSGVMMGLVGLDLLDIALSARGVVLRRRLRFVWRHKGACMGLGIGAGLLLLVPCVNVFLLPATVVAGVLLDQAISPDFPRPGVTA